MRIKCTRPILTNDGVSEIIYYFDSETLELEFNEKDLPLLIQVIDGKAFDVPGMTEYVMVLDETKLLGNKENEELI
jgi:hypothetical protein